MSVCCPQAKAWERHNAGKELIGRTGFLGLTGDKVRLKHYHLQQVKKIMEEVSRALVDDAVQQGH